MAKKLIISISILFILLAPVAVYFSVNRTTNPCNEDKAYAVATDFIQKRLVSPLTAIFPRLDEIDITKENDKCTFAIVGYVDSKNAFNALIRTNYFAKVFLQDGKWGVFLKE